MQNSLGFANGLLQVISLPEHLEPHKKKDMKYVFYQNREGGGEGGGGVVWNKN